MKARYILPVRGLLRVCNDKPLQIDEWTFQFNVNQNTGYVDNIIIQISNIPEEKWPKLSEIQQDTKLPVPQFPFSVNPNAFRFSDIEPKVVNLESYLSVFGLEAIDFPHIEEEWLPDSNDERASILSGFSVLRLPFKQEPVAEPLTNETLLRCIVASNADEKETAALAHFRVGQMHFLNRRFLEAIRHLYMCLEYQFANEKTGKRETLKEFCRSAQLNRTISELFLDGSHDSFRKIRGKYKIFEEKGGAEAFYEFLYELRGKIQHAKPSSLKTWHPSREHKFEDEAVCVMNLAEEICLETAMKKIMAVPPSPAGCLGGRGRREARVRGGKRAKRAGEGRAPTRTPG